MKKLLLSICAILALILTSLYGYANSSTSDAQICASSNQSNDYKYVKSVVVYRFVNGDYKKDGANEIYKNSKGYLYIKARYGNQLYPVYDTKYPHSKYFRNFSSDEWGYTFYFDV